MHHFPISRERENKQNGNAPVLGGTFKRWGELMRKFGRWLHEELVEKQAERY